MSSVVIIVTGDPKSVRCSTPGVKVVPADEKKSPQAQAAEAAAKAGVP